MARKSLIKKFRDVSIARKLYFTVGIMALLIGIELFTLFFSIHTLSSVRAYVEGEGLWSKGQKDAVYQLLKYGIGHDENDYRQFQSYLSVPMGDGKARIEMEKPHPDLAVVREGLIQGKNDPDDVDGMAHLFLRFNKERHLARAITAWGNAEKYLHLLVDISDSLHAAVRAGKPQNEINAILEKITPINQQITIQENDFSFSLAEGARWLENLVMRILFFIALTVEVSGLALAILVNRDIQKGLTEIIEAAKDFARGNLYRRARVISGDEIGTVAQSFNEMSSQLETKINELEGAQRELNTYALELEMKNKELEQFAYVASHDLQEPLRTLNGFTNLLREHAKDKIDSRADTYLRYMQAATLRMQDLIKALLDHGRIGKHQESQMVDSYQLLMSVLDDLKTLIKDKKAFIQSGSLPTLRAHPVELRIMFQNLVTNAIKFQQPGNNAYVIIEADQTGSGWQFMVKDNGIGIEQEDIERIFIMFQRLHMRDEYEGNGIGLAHCMKIAALHAGKIWATSEPGKGSTFFFTVNL
ncbi:sensor histidine kinase [Deminuibacter soli]|uniref:histidine kinase n=1 Tax=Deminuibacter soli TaxID=2291815 RepID=A0A3E1NP24_9BACT|nr:ATP-binding protein [Deminuibacter soli]RFM29538.1 HAMP domain-containing protein [Deminuibacter soli]